MRQECKSNFPEYYLCIKDSKIDIGSKMVLSGENSWAEIISCTVATDHADVTAHGILSGCAPNVKGQLDCIGLILSDMAKIYSVPELEATFKDAELSHEAAVGRISESEIAYLTAWGLSEDEAAVHPLFRKPYTRIAWKGHRH